MAQWQNVYRALPNSAVQALASQFDFRTNLGFIGAHALLLTGAVGLLFFQRYLWLLNIAKQGYGPYQTASYLAGVSAVFILIDSIILWSALRRPQTRMMFSLAWPILFFGSALFVLLANNL